MSENIQPEQTPDQPKPSSEVPAGYDQPAHPSEHAPSWQPPVASDTAAPSYPQPSPPQEYQQQNAQQGYQQGYQQQGYQQQNVQQGYPQQQGYQQGYQQQQGYGMVPEQKSKIVAGILGILLGAWGIHRFYLGDTKMGVIQIVVTVVTFGIGGIWGFIEGIMILVGADPFKVDARGIPLKD
ncbi:TM2 domain-containing protein [Arthrobacter sp. E3]|uniref:TM2 domain-containing protein n=1 Tax=Arthrobacter sp. E3 TaxID=517402 RepID=UPI001FFD34B0|nr:TM2 domain-containing protein [Arthrobacter sp. E3]